MANSRPIPAPGAPSDGWRAGAARVVGFAFVGLLLLPGAPAPIAPHVGPAAASAQELVPPLGGGALTVGTGATIQYFRFGDSQAAGLEALSLITTPFAARTHLGTRLRAEVRGSWARGALERAEGPDVTISGLTDTSLRMDADLVPGAVTLSGTVVLPTGSDAFTFEQMELAGAIAADLLPFRISHWGAGGGGGVSLTAVRSFGMTGVGIDLGVMRSGEFDPTVDAPAAYRPGDALHLTAAMDRIVGGAGKATLRLDARRYGDSELQGENVFRSGSRVGATGSYAFPVGLLSSGLVYVGYRHRAEGTFLTELDARPSQGAFLLGGGVRTPAAGGVITPSADLRAIRRDDAEGQGWSVGLGASGEWDAGDLVLLPALRFHLGSVRVREDVSSGFSGVELSFQIRGGSPRQGGGR